MTYQFEPVDKEFLHVRSKLSVGQRIQTMLDAREILVGLKRGRLRQRYPYLTNNELNMKVLEEIERAKKIRPRFESFP